MKSLGRCGTCLGTSQWVPAQCHIFVQLSQRLWFGNPNIWIKDTLEYQYAAIFSLLVDVYFPSGIYNEFWSTYLIKLLQYSIKLPLCIFSLKYFVHICANKYFSLNLFLSNFVWKLDLSFIYNFPQCTPVLLFTVCVIVQFSIFETVFIQPDAVYCAGNDSRHVFWDLRKRVETSPFS